MKQRKEPESGAPPADAPRELVVLVHGLLRSPRSFALVARALERAGFATRAFGYPSLAGSFAAHASRLAGEIGGCDRDPRFERIHFVGHSLGNLVVRAAISEQRPGKLGRVVMLVPPYRGSPVARRLARWLGDALPVLRQLSDEPGSDARRLPRLKDVSIGVIAARFDHVVRRSSTHLEDEADHVVLSTTHSFALLRPAVHRQIVHFLQHGRFKTGAADPVRPP
jgi:alpha-beta hydrolase superfamily lysophospholipase